MERKENASYFVRIWMAGDIEQAKQICRGFCLNVGLCVTATTFIYTRGEEIGFVVGLLNYPRFPSGPQELERKATDLANQLRQKLFQLSYLLETPNSTEWISCRDEYSAAK